MRVGHVVSSLDRRTGGVAAAVIGLAASQARSGMDVSVVSSFNAGDQSHAAADELRAAGVTVDLVGPAARRFMGWHQQNSAATQALVDRVDLVHIHALWEDIQHHAMRNARRAGRPYVVSPHGMLATWSLRQRSLKKSIYMKLRLRRNLDAASAIHFTTQEEARQAKELALRPGSIIEGLGLDLAEFTDLPPAGTFRDRYPQLAGKTITLFMSRIHPKKGLDLLVPAFARSGGDALVIAGPEDGDYGNIIRELVRAHGLTDRVVFTGMLHGRDRVAALADADLFVLPSYQENFGIVVPEALAAGTPAVVSDQVNFIEYLAGETFAEVVPCDADALGRTLTRWLSDPARRTQAGPAARTWTLARFDWTAIARRWLDHYATLTKSTQ